MNAIRFGFKQDKPTRDHLYPTNDLFATSDGQKIALTIVEEKFWRNFVGVIRDSHPHFDTEQYATETGRRCDGDTLMTQLDEMFASNTAQHWLTLFDAVDVPAALCITPARSAANRSQSRAGAAR